MLNPVFRLSAGADPARKATPYPPLDRYSAGIRAVLARYGCPGQSRFLAGSQIAGFSASYIWDLIVRFINWSMVGAFFVLLVLWLFISQWLRVTVFVSAMVVWLAVSPLLPAFTLWPAGQPTTAAATTAQANTGANAAGAASSPANSDIPPQTEPPTSANLTNWLNAFYAAEQKRKTPFPDQLPADAQPFDLLVINICSLSGRILKPPV